MCESVEEHTVHGSDEPFQQTLMEKQHLNHESAQSPPGAELNFSFAVRAFLDMLGFKVVRFIFTSVCSVCMFTQERTYKRWDVVKVCGILSLIAREYIPFDVVCVCEA